MCNVCYKIVENWFMIAMHLCSKALVVHGRVLNDSGTLDSDSNSDSCSKWFRFWFRCQILWFRFCFQFQHHVISITIPIPTNQALISILTPESVSDSGIIYNCGLLGLLHLLKLVCNSLTVKMVPPLVEKTRSPSADHAYVMWMSPPRKFKYRQDVLTATRMYGMIIEFTAKVDRELTTDYDMVGFVLPSSFLNSECQIYLQVYLRVPRL